MRRLNWNYRAGTSNEQAASRTDLQVNVQCEGAGTKLTLPQTLQTYTAQTPPHYHTKETPISPPQVSRYLGQYFASMPVTKKELHPAFSARSKGPHTKRGQTPSLQRTVPGQTPTGEVLPWRGVRWGGSASCFATAAGISQLPLFW